MHALALQINCVCTSTQRAETADQGSGLVLDPLSFFSRPLLLLHLLEPFPRAVITQISIIRDVTMRRLSKL